MTNLHQLAHSANLLEAQLIIDKWKNDKVPIPNFSNLVGRVFAVRFKKDAKERIDLGMFNSDDIETIIDKVMWFFIKNPLEVIAFLK